MPKKKIETVKVEKLSKKELEKASLEIGTEINKMLESAVRRSNKKLSPYGLKIEISYNITKK